MSTKKIDPAQLWAMANADPGIIGERPARAEQFLAATAVHPAGIVSHEPLFTRPEEPGEEPIAGAAIKGAFPWIDPETIAFDPEITKAAERAAHPLQTLLGGPHVATLPDGSRVNLPAGTVLREAAVQREYTAEENFAALKRMYPSLAGTYERAATKHGIAPWDVTDEQLWEECPALRPEGSR